MASEVRKQRRRRDSAVVLDGLEIYEAPPFKKKTTGNFPYSAVMALPRGSAQRFCTGPLSQKGWCRLRVGVCG